MNDRETALLKAASEKAKQLRNADKLEVWRDGQLVDVRVTEIYDRQEVKKTND